ncbi:hypothetical protein CU669_17420 [Paramagnetospirillum kuznetsovii]|uniref:Cadherin-like domain-containing protein n=1 Tax=Paramagnetospirillum kuznetsovii TaxID=2053833 RepID=A0A364NU56_9PROT|nr:hypothetical protein CU669_17420 [Paramagnetospirillum kuznetsovii]
MIDNTTHAASTDHVGGGTAGHVTAHDPAGGTLRYALQGGTLSVTGSGTLSTQATSHGTIAVNTATGDITFTPNSGAAAMVVGATAHEDATVIVTSSASGKSALASISADITGTNDTPSITGSVSLSGGTVDTTKTIAISTLVGNAVDPDTGETTLLTVTGTVTALHGTAGISGSDVIYTPDSGYTGADTLTYSVADSHGATVTDTASLTIASAPAPLAQSGATLSVTSAATLSDSDLTGFSGITTLTFGTFAGTQGATMGAGAEASGIAIVDASAAPGTVKIDASSYSQAVTITTGSGSDTLTGGSGNDTLSGGAGLDSFIGGAGNDVIHVVHSNDPLIDGGLGAADVLSIDATNFDDINYADNQITNVEIINITNATSAGGWFKVDNQTEGFTINVTSTQNVTIEGSAGNDVINGGNAGEYLWGYYGDDIIAGGGGNNTIDGDSGTDIATYDAMTSGVTATITGSAISVVHDTSNTDTISNVEILVGSTHNDSFSTNGTAAGTIIGDGGTDSFTLTGTVTANQIIDATGGNGTLTMSIADRSAASVITDVAWNGSDIAMTTSGGGTITLVGNAANTIVGSQGHTEIIVDASGANTAGQGYMVVGNSSDTVLVGNTGDDTLVWHSSGVTSSSMDGISGSDTANFRAATTAITASLINGSGTATIGGTSTITLSNMDAIEGGSGNDSLTGDGWLQGGGGDNTLTGYSGAGTASYQDQLYAVTVDLTNGTATHGSGGTNTDTLSGLFSVVGSDFNDTITGSAGNDTITGGIGADHLTGNGGADLFVYTDPSQSLNALTSRDTITDFATGTDHIRLSLSGTHVDVSTFDDSAATYNLGQAGLAGGGVVGDGFYSSLDDALYIYVHGNSTAIGTDGGYVIGSTNAIAASDLQFVITGTSGADTLVGGAGNDTISGAAGDDTLTAGKGGSSLTGGDGADVFGLNNSSGVVSSTITDYASGTDSLSLSNAQFGLGSSGTLTDGGTGNYAESASAMTGTAQNFSGGTATVAGIVAIDNGSNTEVWYTADIHAADTTNSHQVATLNNVNTTALDSTQFHLTV